MKILLKNFYMSRRKDIYLCIYIFFHIQKNRLSICSEIVITGLSIILPQISHKIYDNDDDFMENIKWEKKDFSRIIIYGVNNNLIINN